MEYFGTLNAHAVGIILKEVTRRAMEKIRALRFSFEQQHKVGYDGISDDLVTSADKAAQEIYLRTLRECFPDFGIIAEEGNLSIPCKTEQDIYFTCDPLDGTKAYGRRQSHGIGTMISLIVQEKIISAWVGDVMSREIFGFRPNSQNTLRISDYDVSEKLSINPDRPLKKQKILLRDRPDAYSTLGQELCMSPNEIEISGGSIGTMFARLWKGEAGIILLKAGLQTPWDLNPILGISQQMGFVFVEHRKNEDGSYHYWIPTEYSAPIKVLTEKPEVLVVHSSKLDELQERYKK